MRRHQGGREQLFSPAHIPCLLPPEPNRRNLYVAWDDDPVQSKSASVDAYHQAYRAAPLGRQGARVAAR